MTRGLTPWTGMAGLKSELDRWFDRLGEFKWDEFPMVVDWAPGMDISETKDSVVVREEAGEGSEG